MQVIYAPQPFDINTGAHRLRVFLAGSIEMDTAERWQDNIVNTFTEYDIDFLNPRREHWDNTIAQSIDNPVFKEQVEWEQKGLEEADIILFYFDPKTKSPITLLELGLSAQKGNTLVYCPEGFWRKGNVDIVAERYDIPVFDSLPEFINAAKALIESKLAVIS